MLTYQQPYSTSEDTMTTIAIVIGSTRPGRKAEPVAHWLHQIADFDLPLFDEPMPPIVGRYTKEHTQRWAEAVDRFDGFVFVTPEYNHSTSGALKNAIDFLYREWTNKAAGFVSYGTHGGVRAVEHLRLILAELEVATVRTQVSMSVRADFENYTTFKPLDHHEGFANRMLDEVVAWSSALSQLRVTVAA
jgi:NAD(P)H-dependent FMN reductase